MSANDSRGATLQSRLQDNLHVVRRGPSAGPDLPVIWGVSNTGVFVGGQTADGFLQEAARVLLGGRRVYRYGDTLVYESADEDDRRLTLLAVGGKAESVAAPLLANLLVAGVQAGERSTQSPLPGRLVSALLANEGLFRRLPAISHYARRPVFDADFVLRGPGFHREQGILVHGPDVTPDPEEPLHAPDAPAIDRLPRHLRRLLRDFCWAGDADLSNALALLLTGVLANHFVDDPKPIAILDGNQRGLGKTLFAEAVGRLLDGSVPFKIALSGDEELEKKLGALLRGPQSSLIFFDNVRERIESSTLEANALSPELSFRILGQSANVTRPNTYLWVITSNNTNGTEDLISRALPIRMRYEGNPRERAFGENLHEYVTRHRFDILGELAGMIYRWKSMGMPMGQSKHRCSRWAQVIGGILGVTGFGQFLGNVEDAEASMDEGLQALSGLAEHVTSKGMAAYYTAAGAAADGATPGEWNAAFLGAEVYRDVLAGKNPKGRATWIGTFFSGKVGREVAVNVGAGSAKAVLRCNAVRSGQKRYYFEIAKDASLDELDGGETAEPRPGGEASASTPASAVRPSIGMTEGVAVEGPSPVEEAPMKAESGNDLEWT